MGTNRFYSKELKDEQLGRVNVIRQYFTNLYDLLDDVIPNGREKALYTTKLEESCMWAVKAISEEQEEIEII